MGLSLNDFLTLFPCEYEFSNKIILQNALGEAMPPSVLAIVPARGGSKRLPNKNLLKLSGRTLIEHTAQALSDSGVDCYAVLTTDSESIAEEGRRCGLETPFLRPRHLATDTARTVDVVFHVLDWFKEKFGSDPEIVMVLQPTSPLRGGACIKAGLEIMRNIPNAASVIGMIKLSVSSSYTFKVNDIGFAERVSEETDFPILIPNGAIYITRTHCLRAGGTLYANPVFPLILDRVRSTDIDTKYDLDFAEAMLRNGLPMESRA